MHSKQKTTHNAQGPTDAGALVEHATSAARGYARGVLRGEEERSSVRNELQASVGLHAGRDARKEAVSRLVLAAFDVLMLDAGEAAPEAVRVFAPWHDPLGAIGAVVHQFEHYDAREYRAAIEARGLEVVTMEEWRAMTTPGGAWAMSEAEALEATSAVTGRHVVEVTPADVQAALIEWLDLEA